jgi:hypothetical protein
MVVRISSDVATLCQLILQAPPRPPQAGAAPAPQAPRDPDAVPAQLVSIGRFNPGPGGRFVSNANAVPINAGRQSAADEDSTNVYVDRAWLDRRQGRGSHSG